MIRSLTCAAALTLMLAWPDPADAKRMGGGAWLRERTLEPGFAGEGAGRAGV